MTKYIIFKHAATGTIYTGSYTKNISTKLIQKTIEKKLGCVNICCNNHQNIANYDNILNISQKKIINFTILSCHKENNPVYIESLAQGLLLKENDDTIRTDYEITIVTLTGKQIMLLCKKNYTIPEIKYLISQKEALPIDSQRLIYAGKHYNNDDNATLETLNIPKCVRLHLVLNLRGGMFTQSTCGQSDYDAIDRNHIDFDFDKSCEE